MRASIFAITFERLSHPAFYFFQTFERIVVYLLPGSSNQIAEPEVDPLIRQFQESTSLYIYVLNNPILLTDPGGRQIKEHTQKLGQYKTDPMKFDNKGTLKNAPKEMREKIISGRVKKLEKEIQKFKDNIEKVKQKPQQ